MTSSRSQATCHPATVGPYAIRVQPTAPPERPQATPGKASPPRAPARRTAGKSTTTGSVRAVVGSPATETPAARRRPRQPKPPGLGLLLLPFGGGALAVLLAAMHTALGSPFGAAFAADLWAGCKQAGLMLAVYGPLAGYAHRANQNALADSGRQRYALGETDDEREEGGGDHDYHDDRRRP